MPVTEVVQTTEIHTSVTAPQTNESVKETAGAPVNVTSPSGGISIVVPQSVTVVSDTASAAVSVNTSSKVTNISSPVVLNRVTDQPSVPVNINTVLSTSLVQTSDLLVQILQPVIGPQGPIGPIGPQGPAGSGGAAFVQPTAPVTAGEYLWVQTQIGANNDMTFWVEDGT